jgi:peroxiredoxin
MKRLVLASASLPLLACRPAPGSADTPDSTAGAADDSIIGTERSVEVVELSVPLFGGGAVELERFRGRAVVLEVSASYADGWAELHEHYARLLDAHENDLSVIAVSLDMEPSQLASWERDPPPFTLGWDPQGALAARLGVTRFPTVFVLDRDGVLVEEITGFSEVNLGIEQALARALGTGGAL